MSIQFQPDFRNFWSVVSPKPFENLAFEFTLGGTKSQISSGDDDGQTLLGPPIATRDEIPREDLLTSLKIEVRGDPHKSFRPREGGWPGSGVSVSCCRVAVPKIPKCQKSRKLICWPGRGRPEVFKNRIPKYLKKLSTSVNIPKCTNLSNMSQIKVRTPPKNQKPKVTKCCQYVAKNNLFCQN